MYKIWTHVRFHIMRDVAFNMKKAEVRNVNDDYVLNIWFLYKLKCSKFLKIWISIYIINIFCNTENLY